MSYLRHLCDVLGFDESKNIPFTKQYRLGCSRCSALSINGTPCHERGCSNQSVECFECGCTVPAADAVGRFPRALCPDCANPQPMDDEDDYVASDLDTGLSH